MENRFDEVLRNKLEGLNSTPPAGLWNTIQSNIAADNAGFDQIIGEKLNNLVAKPPASVWSKISHILNPMALPFYKSIWFKRSAAALIIIGSLVFSYFAFDDFSTTEVVDSNPKIEKVKDMDSHANSQNDLIHPVEIEDNTTSNSQIVDDESFTLNQNSTETNINQTTHSDSEIIKLKQTHNSDEEQISVANNEYPKSNLLEPPFTLVESSATDRMDSKEINNIVDNQIVVADIKTSKNTKIDSSSNFEEKIALNANEIEPKPEFNPLLDNNGSLPKNPRNINKYGISFSYIPAKINSSIGYLTHQDFNISMAYQNLNFIANIGFGLGYSSETAEYTIDYNRFEFVKYQFVTDSLGFTYDATSQTYNPVPYGHHEKVYDDVHYNYTAEATTYNTWISIPINVGYIKDFKRFSVLARGGIQYSTVVSRRVVGLFEPDEFSTINSFYYPVHQQINSNISYNLTSGISLRMNENLSLMGEIYGVYFQNPLYQDLTKRAYGYGLKFGLTYYFL